ncbi:MAG: S-layer homology domain-containing protein [Bacillota bacterium]
MPRSKRWMAVVITVAMLVTVIGPALASPPWAPGKQVPKEVHERIRQRLKEKLFQDEDEAPWAVTVMAKVMAKGLMIGFPDEKFKPNASINYTQAVVTALRYAEVALEKAPEGFDGWPPAIHTQAWAMDYLYTAHGKGWIDLESFQVNKAASRSWVCSLVALAAGDEPEGETLEDILEELPFKDKGSIPGEHVWGVYWAWKSGIVQGYPNGMFLPDKPLTRAEMAKILDGTDLVLGKKSVVRGAFVEWDEMNRTITVKLEDGTEKSYPLDEDVRLFAVGTETGLAFLAVGDPVHLEVRDGTVVRIFVLPTDEEDEDN